MFKKLINFISSKKPRYTLKLCKKEFNIDEQGRIYLMITPHFTYSPHKEFLEQLVTNISLLNQIEPDSRDYIFYLYGALKVSEKNDIYTLNGVDLLNKTIIVKQTTKHDTETWSYENFYQQKKYLLLDKTSILNAYIFFNDINNKLATNKSPNNFKNLILIK